MSTKLHLSLDLEIPDLKPGRGSRDREHERAVVLAVAVIVQLLPRLASDAGVDVDRLLGSLLVELGSDVGLSHPPDAAVDALAAATERLRDAMSRRRGAKPKAKLPPPNAPGPTMLQ